MVPLTAQVHFSWIEIFFKTTIRLDKKNSESIILGPLFHYAVKSSQLGRRGEYTIKFNVELLLAPILCSSGMNFFGKQFLFYVSFSEQDNCWEQCVVVVFQLVEWLLPTSESHGSNPVVSRFYMSQVQNSIEKMKIKRGWERPNFL